MSDFNLRHLVREVMDSSTMADPRLLAAEIRRRIPEADRDAALAQCLPDFVREQITRARGASKVLAESPGASPAGRPGRSAKVAGIRDYWQAKLRERMHAGNGEWRMFGDFGFAELMFAAGERRENAARNIAVAEELESYAEALRRLGVSKVRELPADTVRTLGGAAA